MRVAGPLGLVLLGIASYASYVVAAPPEGPDHAGPGPGPGQALTLGLGLGLDEYAGAGCQYEGARYRPGQAVPVKGEPCVRCRCRRGAPICRLRVCAPMPDPPPPGCVILHRANTCCPQLHCPEVGAVDNRLQARHGHPMRYRSDSAGPGAGCYVNGSLFAEGSALSTSSLCDYCYCVRGQQRCVRPQCVLPAPGCVPEYRDHTCCPTSYRCGARHGDGGITSSTTTPSKKRVSGCTVDGRRYREGAQVKSVARGSCETCFCMRGHVRCAPLKCDLPLDGCEPVTAPGKCCPVSYDCSKSSVSTTKTISSITSKVSTGRPSVWENTVRSISYDARSNDARSHREISTAKVTTSTEKTERSIVAATTQEATPEESATTVIAEAADGGAITLNARLDLNGRKNSGISISPNKTHLPEKNKILPVIEAIINKTRQKDQDYDYDYNEPSLPPSLPNLRIIPFVAADAVVKQDKSGTNVDGQELLITTSTTPPKAEDKIDSLFNYFSPPVETEGGFVPRDPVVDGPFYRPSYDPLAAPVGINAPSTTSQAPAVQPELSTRTVVPSAVTPDPLLGNTGSEPCTSGGRQYRHGELLSGVGACKMCFCFDGGVVCQEPSCGAVPPGCRRAPPREPDQCCGSIVCADEDGRDTPLLFQDELHPPQSQRVHSNLPDSAPALASTPAPAPAPASVDDVKPNKKPDKVSIYTKPAPPPPVTRAPQRSSTPPPLTSTSTTSKSTTSTSPSPTPTSSSATPAPAPSVKADTTTAKTKQTVRATTTTTTPTPSTTKPTPKLKSTTVKPSVTKAPAKVTTSTTTTPSTTTSTTAKVIVTSPAPISTTTTTSTPEATTTRTTTATPPTSPPMKPTAPVVRMTPKPISLFDQLWGDADESENEAQDKVDTDVEYTDFVSTNQQEPESKPPPPPPPPEDEDSFSFDKFFELFLDPTTTPPPAPPSTVTTTTTTTTPKPTTTQKPAPSTTPRVTTTTTKKPATSTTTTTPKSAKPPAAPSTTEAPALRTTQKPVSTTTKKVSTTPKAKPKPTTAKPPSPPTTTRAPPKTPGSSPKPPSSTSSTLRTTPRPSTTNRTTSTSPPATSTTTSTTPRLPPVSSTPRSTTLRPAPTTSTSTSRPAPSSTLPPPFGSLKTKPVGALHSSYPAQQHHLMTTRRPAYAPITTASPDPDPDRGVIADPAKAPVSAPSRVSGSGSGLLKLAGCNIYGRMYRVGRIIQELSGPCLECRCTEVGVQCQQLHC